MPCY
ncbi:12812f5a-725a-4fbe-957a-b8045db7af4f [Thermothielavioides terrestris]